MSWERWPTDAVGETPGWAGIEPLEWEGLSLEWEESSSYSNRMVQVSNGIPAAVVHPKWDYYLANGIIFSLNKLSCRNYYINYRDC